jgi:hypothetical protein
MSAESPENKRVAFSVGAKNAKKVQDSAQECESQCESR